MALSEGPRSELGTGQKYFALGLRFAGGIILFMAIGLGLDRWLGLTPVLTLVGTVVGAVLSFISVYRELQAEEAERKARKGRRD